MSSSAMDTDVEERKENGAAPAAAAAAAAAAGSASAAATASTADAAAEAEADVPPNQTLYINNINEKIKKDELKKTLYLIFSAFGNIVEINCATTYKMRGQAWVIFDQLTSATRAQRELQNFLFFGKPIRIAFAKAKSDTLAKLDGTYKQRAKRKTTDDATKPKKGSAQAAAKKQKVEGKKKAATGAGGAAAAAAPAFTPSNEPAAPPHRTLFVENLPAEATVAMLEKLFHQYPGFKEARVIAGKQVAFVDYTEIFEAVTAKEAMQGWKVSPTNLLKITFAKQ